MRDIIPDTHESYTGPWEPGAGLNMFSERASLFLLPYIVAL